MPQRKNDRVVFDTNIIVSLLLKENFEFFVLDGAKLLIEKHKPIVYAELWENENRDNCFRLFQNLNYKIMVVVKNKIVPFDKSNHKTQNFIFIPA